MFGRTETAILMRATGRNEACLAEFQLRNGYSVHRLRRPSPLFNTSWSGHLCLHPHERGEPSKLHYGNLTVAISFAHLVHAVRLDEIDNLPSGLGGSAPHARPREDQAVGAR